MNWIKGKRVLITGHTGFKGAWLAHMLDRAGAKVTGVSLVPHTSPNLFHLLNLGNRIDHHVQDIRDGVALQRLFEQVQPEVVFHLAAQAIVRESYDDPKDNHDTNVLGTVHVLEAIRSVQRVRAAVIVTTDKVYENNETGELYKEDAPLGGYDPYSASKAAADVLTTSYIRSYFHPDQYGEAHNTLIGIMRSGNVIGGGDWGADRLVPDIMRGVFEKDEEIVLRNPSSTRPWQHVLEPLYAYVMMAERLYEGDTSVVGPMNIGPVAGDHGISVESLLKRMIQHIGKGTYRVECISKKHEAGLLGLSIQRAQDVLGWQPRLTLDQTLDWTASWYQTWYQHPEQIVAKTNEQIDAFYAIHPGAMKRVRLSIVVPCHNEEEVLPSTHQTLSALASSWVTKGLICGYELLFVNNGSTDDTISVMNELYEKDDHVTIVDLRKNYGFQGSITAGLFSADGDAVVTIDADLQDDPEAIEHMLHKYAQGYEMVLGVRSERTADSWFKRWTAQSFYTLINKLGVTAVYNHADFRLLSRDTVDALKQYPERVRFLRSMIFEVESRYATVEYKRRERTLGESKFSLRELVSFALDGITSFSSVPIRLVSLLGFFMFFLSLIGLGFVLYVKLIQGVNVPGWAFLAVIILFFGGVQNVSLGIIGDYVAKIFTESKQRPIYVVRTLHRHK